MALRNSECIDDQLGRDLFVGLARRSELIGAAQLILQP
jgi:hypothetical protein